ncbi:MAG: cupin domain-containing protein [Alphaproteobacteria bacterium]|nr:cupin domain-containing protein [Alphaproteobacteria bacterium]
MRSRLASIAVLVASVFALGIAAAQAGGCPADKLRPGGNGQAPSSAAAKGVTDTVIAQSDLGKEPIGLHDRQFRLRRLVIQPGGIVPWHSHGNRPALIYVVAGEVTEYASTCAVPIVHRAGDATAETHATAHWWKNTGSTPAVLLSADLFPAHDDAHMM